MELELSKEAFSKKLLEAIKKCEDLRRPCEAQDRLRIGVELQQMFSKIDHDDIRSKIIKLTNGQYADEIDKSGKRCWSIIILEGLDPHHVAHAVCKVALNPLVLREYGAFVHIDSRAYTSTMRGQDAVQKTQIKLVWYADTILEFSSP